MTTKVLAVRFPVVLKAVIVSFLIPTSNCFVELTISHRRNPRLDPLTLCSTHLLPSKVPSRSPVRIIHEPHFQLSAHSQQRAGESVARDKKHTARSLAVEALLLQSHLPIADRLSSLPSFTALSLRDRAFCRLLIATVERRFGQIDALLQDRLDRKPPAFVHAVLRVGVAQIVFLDTPPHAAVQATVSLVRHRRHRGLVNAVLRRISATTTNNNDGDPNATITCNAAPWLVQALTKDWGVATTEQIIACAMEESPRTITVHPERVVEAGYAEEICEAVPYVAAQFVEAEILPQGSIRVRNQPGPINEWPMFDDGVWWCQDPSATLPALAIQSALGREEHSSSSSPPSVIDLCAAPGGKTAQLVSFGYHVTAVDASSQRSKRLRENMERISSSSKTWRSLVADGTVWMDAETSSRADAVLIDVPCSATGTASKRPDVLRKEVDTMRELLPLQQKLAQHAIDHLVRAGGIVVYATCSLLQCESEDQVRTLLATNANRLEVVPFEPGTIPGFDRAITNEGWMRVLPGSFPEIGACDGFFVARLRKIAA